MLQILEHLGMAAILILTLISKVVEVLPTDEVIDQVTIYSFSFLICNFYQVTGSLPTTDQVVAQVVSLYCRLDFCIGREIWWSNVL